MKFQYVVAGIHVTSDQPISDLKTHGDADATVTLHIGDVIKMGVNDCYFYPNDESPLACIQRDGQVIWLRRADAIMVRQAVPFAAALQGKITLHAAAIGYQNKAYAFVGASGAGKSTLARAFAARGMDVIADDLLACRDVAGRVVVVDGERLLAAVYFLHRDHLLADIQLTALTKKSGLQSLIAHGFGELHVSAIWAMQFAFYQQIVDQVALYDLFLPDSLDRLPASITSLMTHWRATT